MTDNELIKMLEEALRVADETINRQKAEIDALIAGQETLQKNLPKVIKAEAIKEFAERADVRITEVYNKHIFGYNDLNDEEKEAIMNFSDDITSGLDDLSKEMTEESNVKL